VKLTLELYLRARARLAELGHGGDVEWAENVKAPTTPEKFVCEYVRVVLNSGMKNTIARKIMDRVWPRLYADEPITDVFRHPGKRDAIEGVWRQREFYFRQFLEAVDPVAWCETLPWIGGITKFHLAKNLGVDCAKPDRWLVRLAALDGETVEALCRRLAEAAGDRVATVDVILWRACAVGVLVIHDGGVELAEGRSAA
jgi:hypothetical protein